MTTSIRDFLIELYQEYLEEASFLYEQRLALFEDPEITWQDIGDFEQRFEPHIDGLVVGGELALEICQLRAREGDFGELHAAVIVFCRQNRKDLVRQVLKELDPEDAEKMKAVSDALKYEIPTEWQDEFLRMISEDESWPENKRELIPIIASLAGYRRLKAGTGILLAALRVTPADSLPEVIRALGRLGEQSARLLLLPYLHHEDESVSSAAALALLRLGEQQAINCCSGHAPSKGRPLISTALGGGRSSVQVLLEMARTGQTGADCLIGLGLLGDISALPTLLVYLGHPEAAESAALALHLITGAQLYEEVFVPDEIDPDELFEGELENLSQGKVPTRPDGKPFGTTITRISLNPEVWQKWWTQNRSRFSPQIRYRNGQPYSPACLLANLESEQSPHKIRQFAYEELVIRYGLDLPFETDMPVIRQKQALASCAQWVENNNSRFREGQWYFAGQIIP
ncbi:MAG: HEAT repeat domain-containing protein [bacterium]